MVDKQRVPGLKDQNYQCHELLWGHYREVQERTFGTWGSAVCVQLCSLMCESAEGCSKQDWGLAEQV